MEQKLKELQERKAAIVAGGGEKKIASQQGSGKKTARQRIEAFLDNGSFVEIDAFVEHRSMEFDMASVKSPCDGVVVGYGTVDGRLVYIYSQDFTVNGGSIGEMHAKKICKAMDLAMKAGCPCIGVIDSIGARIQEGVDALAAYGDIYYRNTLASGLIPQISVVMGPCAGAAVYSPAITDFTVMVNKTSSMFINGPQVVKAATNKELSIEELGGAKVHAEVSGTASLIYDNEEDTFAGVRKLLSYIPANNIEDSPLAVTSDAVNRKLSAVASIIPEDSSKAYDVREVIKAVFDDGDFFEIQECFAKNIVVGFARIAGRAVGVVANQPNVMSGALDINASEKASHFVRFCDSFNIPLVTFTDTKGYVACADEEHNGAIRHGAKLLYAYSEATVPKLTVVLGKAYGGAYIAMCSKNVGADQVFAWPTAEITVISPEGAANILYQKEIDAASKTAEVRKEKVAQYKANYANPYKAASRGYIDDVIDPADTRARLASALSMLAGKRELRPAKKHGNFPV